MGHQDTKLQRARLSDKEGGTMTLENQYGDTIEVTDRIMAIIRTEEQNNYGYFATVGGAKRWINQQRGGKCTWSEN